MTTIEKVQYIRNFINDKAEYHKEEIKRSENSIRIDARANAVDFGSVENSAKYAMRMATRLEVYNEVIGYIDGILNSEVDEDDK